MSKHIRCSKLSSSCSVNNILPGNQQRSHGPPTVCDVIWEQNHFLSPEIVRSHVTFGGKRPENNMNGFPCGKARETLTHLARTCAQFTAWIWAWPWGCMCHTLLAFIMWAILLAWMSHSRSWSLILYTCTIVLDRIILTIRGFFFKKKCC